MRHVEKVVVVGLAVSGTEPVLKLQGVSEFLGFIVNDSDRVVRLLNQCMDDARDTASFSRHCQDKIARTISYSIHLPCRRIASS